LDLLNDVVENVHLVCLLHGERLENSTSPGTYMQIKETNGPSWSCHHKLSLSQRRNETQYCTLISPNLLNDAFSIEYVMKLVMIGLAVNGNF
jgi:hypothetical protein